MPARSYKNSDKAPPIMQGTPVPPEWRLPPEWSAPPWNRWAFQHIREIVTTTPVHRGPTIWDLPGSPEDISAIAFADATGASTTWGAMIEASYTDGTLVFLDGRVIAESYHNSMTPRTEHLAMSVSKSIVATVAGKLIEEGLLDPAGRVDAIIPELGQTAWQGATLQQVLDMTSGVRFDETYDAPLSDVSKIDIAAGWKPPPMDADPGDVPDCLWDIVMSLKVRDADHGARFEYRSIETELLGLLMERAAGRRLADLVSDGLWAPMGAQEDACFSIDRAGTAVADGGFCATMRDFGRFGRLLLEDGRRDGRPVIPTGWIEDIRAGDHGLFNAYGRGWLPNGVYRNQFWIEDRAKRAIICRGIFGQYIYIDPDRGLVAVKLSTLPDALDEEIPHFLNWMAGLDALCSEFGVMNGR